MWIWHLLKYSIQSFIKSLSNSTVNICENQNINCKLGNELNFNHYIALFNLFSYLTASGVFELITKRCLKIREPIENQQHLLLPLLAMIGFITKITEICPRGS